MMSLSSCCSYYSYIIMFDLFLFLLRAGRILAEMHEHRPHHLALVLLFGSGRACARERKGAYEEANLRIMNFSLASLLSRASRSILDIFFSRYALTFFVCLQNILTERERAREIERDRERKNETHVDS